MKPKWELNHLAFEKLLSWLDKDHNIAAEKYEAIRRRLIKILDYRSCFDSESIADETFDRVAKKIDWLIENYQGDPTLYFLAVANNIYLEYIKKPRQEELHENIVQKETDEEDFQPEYECLQNCLQKLNSEQREFILNYYQGEKSEKINNRKKLVEDSGKGVTNLRVQAHRIRAKLQKCVTECVERKNN
jgi:DNA-directed RNA polymerase specialized sigma24 family protein